MFSGKGIAKCCLSGYDIFSTVAVEGETVNSYGSAKTKRSFQDVLSDHFRYLL